MTVSDPFIFDSLSNEKKIALTQCSLTEEPEVVVAIMGEDIPEDFEEPLFLGNKYVVVLPQIIAGYAKEITIWFSKDVDPETMSNLIQSYFNKKFPNLEINDSTSMGISEAGKIIIVNNTAKQLWCRYADYQSHRLLFGYERRKWALEKASKRQGENQPVGANKVRNPEINATIAKM